MRLLAVARTTALEALREKVLYGLVVFGLGTVLLSIVLSQLTLGHRIRMITDLSMTGLLASGLLLAAIVGSSAICRDVDRRTTLPILAKPIGRTSYLLGRFLGVLGVVAVNFGLMVGFTTAAIWFNSPATGFPFGWGAYAATVSLIFLRIGLMTALSVTLSGVVSTTVAQVAALGIAVAGHFTGELRFFLSKDQGPLGQVLAELLYRTVPDLGALDSLYELIHGQPIATAHLALSAAYAICYAGAALALGCWAFSRRELS